jgi:hypothetical protein
VHTAGPSVPIKRVHVGNTWPGQVRTLQVRVRQNLATVGFELKAPMVQQVPLNTQQSATSTTSSTTSITRIASTTITTSTTSTANTTSITGTTNTASITSTSNTTSTTS